MADSVPPGCFFLPGNNTLFRPIFKTALRGRITEIPFKAAVTRALRMSDPCASKEHAQAMQDDPWKIPGKYSCCVLVFAGPPVGTSIPCLRRQGETWMLFYQKLTDLFTQSHRLVFVGNPPAKRKPRGTGTTNKQYRTHPFFFGRFRHRNKKE